MVAGGRRTAWVVLALLVASAGAFIYWRTAVEDLPGDYHVRKGNYRLEDGQYEEALAEFDRALAINPEHPAAHLGTALTYVQMGRLPEAVERLDRLLELDPDNATALANRGIAQDRLGLHERALHDYRAALALDPRLSKGPGWLWRFLHNQSEKPPTIRDRAEYLETELAKAPEERLLTVPEEDEKQRMYKVR